MTTKIIALTITFAMTMWLVWKKESVKDQCIGTAMYILFALLVARL